MKPLKSILALILCLALLSSLAVFGFAQQSSTTGEFSTLCYNVSGLPNIKFIINKADGVDVKGNQLQLGRIFNNSDYDIIAVQEDFGYHKSLVKYMDNYTYQTNHIGGIPGGDGLNIFSKTPIYNEQRITWDMAYGVINDGADELTPKGILYSVVDVGNGVLVDYYNVHADAYSDDGSVAARTDNLKQLAELINSNDNNRPVIVTGDFNTSIHNYSNCEIKESLLDSCGLKDAWIEINNNGDYEDFSFWIEKYGAEWGQSWGRWDSVEKFLYKDGGGVKINPTSCEYIYINNADGESISDHAAISAKFTYEITDDYVQNTQPLNVPKASPFKVFLQRVKYVFIDLFKIFSHFDDLKALL